MFLNGTRFWIGWLHEGVAIPQEWYKRKHFNIFESSKAAGICFEGDDCSDRYHGKLKHGEPLPMLSVAVTVV